ncbi:hypothetical protein HGRIS_012562 [Hohenbuehelia grisea]|uniref:Peptidase A2 domain-containing protein n=1 Tax=Hohenbuehelia grisea TaxID=104357 RepID=A0ABR3ISR8_9AGAR
MSSPSIRRSVSSARSLASKISGTSYAPSVCSDSETLTPERVEQRSSKVLSNESLLAPKPTRDELNEAVGNDLMAPTTDLNSIPCAGVRISYGPLAGLMAWRFVVQLNEPDNAFKRAHPAVVVNFILDTGSNRSRVPPETLQALGYKGSLRPGSEARLLIQGVPTKCDVAYPEEAGRLSSQFLLAGDLTLYMDPTLGAPVLYVAEQGAGWPNVSDIHRTVPPTPWTLKGLVKMLLHSKSNGQRW